MKFFINYAHNFFYESQKKAIDHAKNFGFLCKEYGYNDLDENFKNNNINILNKERGAGYWLWKPYIILDMLNKIDFNDYLVYMDSGAYLIKDVDNYLKCIDDTGILAFQLTHKQSKYTKGDCFYIINDVGEENKFKDEFQNCATFIFFKKTQYSINFVKKWLFYSTHENLLTDSPNLYKQNFEDFIDHRHDQSIFSLLTYKYKIKSLPDISQYAVEHGLGETWICVNSHRNKL